MFSPILRQEVSGNLFVASGASLGVRPEAYNVAFFIGAVSRYTLVGADFDEELAYTREIRLNHDHDRNHVNRFYELTLAFTN